MVSAARLWVGPCSAFLRGAVLGRHDEIVETDSSAAVLPRSVLGRLSEGVCRRAFSSPEAALYEATIAVALSRVVLPALRQHVTGRKVLDVGAGGGRLAVALCSDCSVVGIDPSWPQVRRLHRRADGLVAAVRARGESLPFASDAFDTVYSSCVYKHWRAPAAAMRECARVTRPGGRLITIEIDGEASAAEAAALDMTRTLAAFHLDKLVAVGLLGVDRHRPAGRSGRGAGRPAKWYSRLPGEISVSVPERHYELAARHARLRTTTNGERCHDGQLPVPHVGRRATRARLRHEPSSPGGTRRGRGTVTGSCEARSRSRPLLRHLRCLTAPLIDWRNRWSPAPAPAPAPGEWPGGIAPPGSRRTGRDGLPSSGSTGRLSVETTAYQ